MAVSMNNADAPESDEYVLELRRGQSGIERHHGGAHPRDGVQELEIAVAVQRQDGDPVARPHTQCGNRAGDAADPLQTLLPGSMTSGEMGCDAVGFDLDGAAQPLGQCEHGGC